MQVGALVWSVAQLRGRVEIVTRIPEMICRAVVRQAELPAWAALRRASHKAQLGLRDLVPVQRGGVEVHVSPEERVRVLGDLRVRLIAKDVGTVRVSDFEVEEVPDVRRVVGIHVVLYGLVR